MSWIFWVLAAITIAGAMATVLVHRLVHAALGAAVAFVGLALLFLSLDAQFAGFAQLMVYVGAVTILILFAILMTQSGELNQTSTKLHTVFSPGAWWGLVVAALVFAVLGYAVNQSQSALTKAGTASAAVPSATVAEIGQAFVGRYVLPLEIVALILTAALIGAVVIAMNEKGETQ
jgi:NADH-quinone oxidoreductase subunit J